MGNAKENQLLVYAKMIGPEVAEYAAAESQATGHTIAKNGLAREIFLWAWAGYKAVGSLAELKRIEPTALAREARRAAPEQKKRKAG